MSDTLTVLYFVIWFFMVSTINKTQNKWCYFTRTKLSSLHHKKMPHPASSCAATTFWRFILDYLGDSYINCQKWKEIIYKFQIELWKYWLEWSMEVFLWFSEANFNKRSVQVSNSSTSGKSGWNTNSQDSVGGRCYKRQTEYFS